MSRADVLLCIVDGNPYIWPQPCRILRRNQHIFHTPREVRGSRYVLYCTFRKGSRALIFLRFEQLRYHSATTANRLRSCPRSLVRQRETHGTANTGGDPIISGKGVSARAMCESCPTRSRSRPAGIGGARTGQDGTAVCQEPGVITLMIWACTRRVLRGSRPCTSKRPGRHESISYTTLASDVVCVGDSNHRSLGASEGQRRMG